MDITIPKPVFLRGLRLTRNIADKSGTMAILTNVLLRTNGSQLIVAATDLHIEAMTDLTAAVSKPGAILVPAKQLYDAVNSLPEVDIRLRLLEDTRLVLKGGKTEFKLPTLNAKDFPKLENPHEQKLTDVDSPTLRDMLSKTVFAVSQSDEKPGLAAVLYACDGAATTMFATDTHRLSLVKRELPGPVLGPLLIPRNGAAQLLSALAGREAPCKFGVSVNDSNKWLIVRIDDAHLIVKLTEATPFPYEQIVPVAEATTINVVVPRVEFMASLKRVMLVKNDSMFLTMAAGSLVLSARDGDRNQDIEENVEVEGDGALRMRLNPKFMFDILDNMDGPAVKLGLSSDESPVVIKQGDGHFLGIVMPLSMHGG